MEKMTIALKNRLREDNSKIHVTLKIPNSMGHY